MTAQGSNIPDKLRLVLRWRGSRGKAGGEERRWWWWRWGRNSVLAKIQESNSIDMREMLPRNSE